MAQKWNLGDIVPPERDRRSARPHSGARTPLSDVRRGPAHPTRPVTPRQAEEADEAPRHLSHDTHSHLHGHDVPESLDDEVRDIEIRIGKTSRIKRTVAISAIVLFALGAGVASTMLMGGADITVMPKSKVVTVSGALEANKSPRAGELGYEILSFEESGERTVPATGQEKVTERASGMMTITNAHSATKQRLIKNTRFESQNGLIYRITESIEIPGYTKDGAGKTVPGVASAKVLADGTGEQYNIAPARFTIPGLKGSEQFTTVYGETKETLTGGYDGMKFIIDEGELSKARQEVHLELREKLSARLKAERPNGFVFYEPSVTFIYSSLPPTEAGEQSVTIKEQARLNAPLFKTDAFASFIAKRAVPGYEGEPVRLEDPLTLAFSYPKLNADISAEGFEFILDGQTEIIWTYDKEKLRNDVKGADQDSLYKLLAAFPAIEKSKAVIKPFWRNSFPSDIEKIRIIESFEAFQ